MANRDIKDSVVLIDQKDIARIKSRLDQLEPKFRNKTLRKALRAGTKPIQKETQRQAPVLSGRLKRAIKVRSMKKKRNRIGFNVTIGDKNFVGDTFYGGFLEFGTKNESGEWVIEPREFMEKAFQIKDKEALRTIIDTVESEFERLMKEVA